VGVEAADWALDDPQQVEAPTTGLVLTIKQRFTVAGRIVDARGVGVGNITLRARQVASGISWQFSTDAAGAFSIPGVSDGTCEFFVDSKGDGSEISLGTVRAGTTDAVLRLPD